MGSMAQPRQFALAKRKLLLVALAIGLAFYLLRSTLNLLSYSDWDGRLVSSLVNENEATKRLDWAKIPENYPLTHFKPLPASLPKSKIPKIQALHFPTRTAAYRRVQEERLAAVKGNFTHAWMGYKAYAWLKDEVAPLSGGYQETFGGWAASLVDALATLWVMGLHEEFEEAVEAVNEIDFSTCAVEEINVFETTIRYLGGFLSAYDLTGGNYPKLLLKAIEIGEMLYHAFDTPNRMPVMRWNFQAARHGEKQEAGDSTLVAEIGSLTLEFTRLSQLTGDYKFYDAVQRIMDVFQEQQNQTKLPGMWPVVVNARQADFREDEGFTLGGMADSLYEYLPKQHLLIGAGSQQYQKLYEAALQTMKRNIFYRPMTLDGYDVLLAGQTNSDGKAPVQELETEPQAQHLACFAGGMVGLGARIFGQEHDIETARKLVEGCLWGYENGHQGIMPEVMRTLPCENKLDCSWDEKAWLEAVRREHNDGDLGEAELKARFPPGVVKIDDPRYILRPEAIESVWYLYRLTGDTKLQDRAWNMFNNIIKHTKTDIAHAALADCTIANPPQSDRMESFWLAETLLYFYLIFSEPDVISLDDFVLNTEAHPLKRPD